MVYFDGEGRISRFFIGDVDLDECGSMFSLSTDNNFLDRSVSSEMLVVPENLNNKRSYVGIVKVYRESTDRNEIVLNDSDFGLLNKIIRRLLLLPGVIVGWFGVFSVGV